MTSEVPFPPKFCIVTWRVSEITFHRKAAVETALTNVSCHRQCVLGKTLDYKKALIVLQ